MKWMPSDDDDFWTTYIASTPEEDNDFRGVSRMIFWPIVVLIVAIVIAALMR
jgi:hypothetical protein